MGQRALGRGGELGRAGVVHLHVLVGAGAGVVKNVGIYRHLAGTFAVTPGMKNGGEIKNRIYYNEALISRILSLWGAKNQT